MENEINSPETGNLTSDIKPKKSNKIYYIILAILLVLGVIYWYSSQKQEAVNQDLSLSPTEVEQLSGDEKDRVLLLQLKALEEEASKLTPESDRSDRFTTYIQLAEVRTALGKHQEALDALEQIRKEREGNTRLWMTYSQVYKNMGNLPDAIGNAKQALKIDPGIPQNWLFLIELSKDLSRPELDALYQQALVGTENAPEIQSAYDTFKAQS